MNENTRIFIIVILYYLFIYTHVWMGGYDIMHIPTGIMRF